ncbi:leucine-rich repeat, cysteine-containing subtype protein [Tanacetum coccineum]
MLTRATWQQQQCPNPSRLSQRFPFIDSLTLEGFPFEHIRQFRRLRNHITPWIKEIAVKFTCLKELQIRGLFVNDEDLETFATSRGKDLRVLKINNCGGLWEKGFDWFEYNRYDVQDLTILAKKCSKSLVSLKIAPCSLSLLGDAFRHALRLEDFSGAYDGKGEDYVDFKLPPNMRCFGAYDLHVTALTFLLPLANQLKELNLQCMESGPNCVCFLIKRCPNLEVLYTKDRCGNRGMQVIGLFCKKLRKLTYDARVTSMGLIALAHGCNNLEYIKVRRLKDISNEAMECVGTHLKNLHNSVREYGKKKYTARPWDSSYANGLQQTRKAGYHPSSWRTDGCGVGQAVATLVFNMHSLRYVCVEGGYRTVLALTRPDIEL